MFASLFKSLQQSTTPHQLYGAVMAQSRQPWFFSVLKVPDTVMGRFDMLAMHTYLLARRLVAENDTTCRALNQEVFDLFVDDIDRALRELGIGDTTVPKRKKKLVRSFYGQIEDFDDLLDNKNISAVENCVAARYFKAVSGGDAPRMAAYILETDKLLMGQQRSDILRGNLVWPDFSK